MPIIELPDIVQSLQNKRWTGTLEVVSGTARRGYLFFRDGVIQHRKMDQSRVILGRALYELGLIDEADYVMTLVDHERTGRRLGEILVELGLVDQKSIRQALGFQGREDVFEIFNWSNLDVKFHPGEPPLPAVFGQEDLEVSLNLPGMSVLMEAARRADEWELIRSTIPSEHDVLAPANGALPDGLIDRRVALLVDGYRSAYEIAEQAPIATLECLKALGELVQQGHLKALESQELVRVGVEAERDEDWEKALHVYELAAERGLEHLDLHRRIACAYQRLGKTREALDRWIAVSERCLRLDRRDLAVGALRDALDLSPDDVQLRLRLARLLVTLQAPEEAANEFREVITRALASSETDEALIGLHQELLDLAPTDKAALQALAELHARNGDIVPAMTRLDELATVHDEEGRPEDAVAVLYRILELDGENLEARLRLAQTLARMGSTDDAVREYRRLADVLYRSGLIANSINWPFLIKVYESIVELEPSSTAAWEWLAKAYLENGERDKAISRYLGMAQSLQPAPGDAPPPELLQPLRRIVELAPDRLDVRRRLAEAHLALNQVDRAVRCLRELAEAALQLGDRAAAREAYDDALAAAPFDLDSRRGLAGMAEAEGDLEGAQRAWRAIGGMALFAGLHDDAGRDLRRAVKLRPDDTDALLDLGRAEEARGSARTAAAAYARYAELMLGRGNQGCARDALERTRALEPGHPQAAQLLARLS